MAKLITSALPIFLIFVALTNCAFAAAAPRRMKTLPLQEYLLDEPSNAEPREFYGMDVAYPLRQVRRGLDSLSGATFGESKRSGASPKVKAGNFDEIDRSAFDRFSKRNIDEIDRTPFDSFFKRNFDEIDRVGWSGFVKRLDNYLADKQMR